MSKVAEKALELFKQNKADLIIGYEEGTKKPRPIFCSNEENIHKLILNSNCTNNLAVYLTKKEIVEGKKVCVIGLMPTLRSILQIAAENQIKEDNLIVITLDKNDNLIQFANLDELEKYVAEHKLEMDAKNKELLAKLDAMSREERFAYWTKEMEKCFKCYACRSACPLCYCTKCIVEVNRPQWIDAWAAPLSNLEWQINRSMHMAGRCTGCGACGEACPVNIPVHLLTAKMLEELSSEFGFEPGQPNKNGNPLSTFRPDDKENFIR